MTTDFVQQTAQIIEFPRGGRKAPAPDRAATDRKAQAAVIAAAEAWYHDAAIEEEGSRGGRR